MKNIFAYILGFLMISMLFAGTNVWAQDLTGSGTITDSASGPGLAVQLSPKVTVSYFGDPDEFVLCGFNTSGTVEYGVTSGTQGVYMHAATALTSLAAVSDASTIEGWTLMGSAGGS